MAKMKKAVEIFGERLRSARELRGLSQRELSEKLGVPPSSIAHFEGGRRKPSFENLYRLANALEVTTDYLFGRTEEPVLVPPSDPLLRELAKLGGEDRELIAAMLGVLNQRKRNRRATR